MFKRTKADKTKPIDPPPGYKWFLLDKGRSGGALELQLLPESRMDVLQGGQWYYRHPGDGNFMRGALIPASIYGHFGRVVTKPKELRRASIDIIAAFLRAEEDKEMKRKLKELISDNP